MKVVLIAGHKPTSPGSVNQALGETEFNINKATVLQVFRILSDYEGIEPVIVWRGMYKDLPDQVKTHKPDLVISMHANAFNTRARGSEVLYYYKDKRAAAYAKMLQSHFIELLGLPDRGVKPKSAEERGGYLLAYTEAPTLIGEPFFVDNDEELLHMRAHFGNLVRAYAQTVIDIYNTYFKKV